MEECRQRKLSDYPPVAQSANMGNGKEEMNMDLGIIKHLHSTTPLLWIGMGWRNGGMEAWDGIEWMDDWS